MKTELNLLPQLRSKLRKNRVHEGRRLTYYPILCRMLSQLSYQSANALECPLEQNLTEFILRPASPNDVPGSENRET